MLQKQNHALLLEIDAFLKLSRKQLRVEFAEKALALIKLKLGDPCCTDSDAVVNLVTKKRNNFINAVEQTLKGMSPLADYTTLILAKEKLERVIANPCCLK